MRKLPPFLDQIKDPLRRAEIEERVSNSIDRSGGEVACWPWRFARTTKRCGGFGKIKIGEKYWLAHRLVMALTSGGQLPPHALVIQACGNSVCCNPRHLFLKDGAKKKRPPRIDAMAAVFSSPDPLRRFRLRFWSKVETLGHEQCWDWRGSTHKFGYGVIGIGGTTEISNRIAFALEHGLSSIIGKHIRHTCDRPQCCNVLHLRAGTRKDNIDDMTTKLRHAWGERSGKAKLCEAQVLSIRSSAGRSIDVARQFGTTRQTVNDIRVRRSWAHLEAS